MIEFSDSAPRVDVVPEEYVRLLGYPRGWTLEGRARELADWAREWYAQHGRPWVYARGSTDIQLEGQAGVIIDGARFDSARLQTTLADAGADRVIVAAVSAGAELEEEAQARWRDGKPDEYFFLEIFGSAVVEHLITITGARLCAWADGERAAVLPHYSPGYPEWAIDDQARLLDVIRGGRPGAVPLEVFDTGMLRPKKSLLAVFGVTPHLDRVGRLTELSPCASCSYAPCAYRRAPYRRARRAAAAEVPAAEADVRPLTPEARYSVSLKALRRWSRERLTLERRADGTVAASFRYEGTTCTNMGRPLQFNYHVTLGRRDEGYPILEQSCAPAPGDLGYTSMCRYLKDGDRLMAAVAAERPLHGQRLDDVVSWTRPSSPAGCYCDVESRLHKWGLVLETIHFALAKGDSDE